MRTRCLVLALGFFALAAQLPADAEGTANGAVLRGKADFVSYGCYECHGTVGQGNLDTGPRLTPPAIPAAGIAAYIRRPAGVMPAYTATILPDKDVADIAAYLASISPGKTASAIAPLARISTTPR